MSRVALWSVANDRPARLPDHSGFLEKHLETWVQNDPSMVLDGLRWVGRQIVLPDRSRLDLLGVTPEGEWVVAELKAGPLDIAALNQALSYAMHVGSMQADDLLARIPDDPHGEVARYAAVADGGQRPVSLLLVGTSRAAFLKEGMGFLKERGLNLAVRVVTFSLFRESDGAVLLAREIEETDGSEPVRTGSGIDRILEVAGTCGVREELNRAVQMAGELRLRTKAWPWSFTINSPANWRKTLLYFAPIEAAAKVGFSSENFAEAFNVTENEVVTALGKNWATLQKGELAAWIRRAEEFTRSAQARAESSGRTP